MQTTFFSCSYGKDLDRAVWMRRSVDRFLKQPCRHLIAVPRADIASFRRRFQGDRYVEIVAQNDTVRGIFYPDLFYRLLGALCRSQRWRFENHAGKPGWITQQVAKLGCTRWIEDGAIVVVDSDVIFTREFDLLDLGIDNRQRNLVRITPKDEASRHRDHLARARVLLGLPPGPTEHHYISQPVIWYADWLRELQAFLEVASGEDWQLALHRANQISEYTIYGAFIEEVLKPANLAVTTSPYHVGVWDDDGIRELLDLAEPSLLLQNRPLALVIQSNIGTPVSAYQHVLQRIIENQMSPLK